MTLEDCIAQLPHDSRFWAIMAMRFLRVRGGDFVQCRDCKIHGGGHDTVAGAARALLDAWDDAAAEGIWPAAIARNGKAVWMQHGPWWTHGTLEGLADADSP